MTLRPFQAFRFPLCITTIHLMTKFMLAAACRSVHSCLTGRERVTLSWRPYVQKVSLAGESRTGCAKTTKLSSKYLHLIFIVFFLMVLKMHYFDTVR